MVLTRRLFYTILIVMMSMSSFLNAQGLYFGGADSDGYAEADEIGLTYGDVTQKIKDLEDSINDPEELLEALEKYRDTVKDMDDFDDQHQKALNNAISRAEGGAGPAYYLNMIIGGTGIVGTRKIVDLLTNPGVAAMSADGFNVGTKGMISINWQQFLKSMQIFASVLFIVVIGIGVFKLFLNPGQTVISQILLRPILILIALALYSDLSDLLIFDPIELIVQSIYVDYDKKASVVVESFSDMIMALKQHADAANESGGFIKVLSNALMSALFWVILMVVKSVIAYIFFLGTCMSAIYFGLGPIAIAFSLIPGNENVLQKWFFGLISYLLWQPILILIMMITITAFSVLQSTMGTMSTNALLSLCLAVALIFFLLMTPKIANVLVSEASEAGQGMISNVGDYAGEKAREKGYNALFGSK